jgi:hypothetical protein
VNIKRVLGLIAGFVLILGGILLLFYDPGGVTITWETASEVDTMGFNLYRAEGAASESFQQVNAELVPAQGDPLAGASYQIEDKEVKPGRLYSYQIEEVEWSGARQRYPEVVQVRAGLPRFLLIVEGVVLILLGCGLLYLVRQGRRLDREPAE